MLNEKKGIGFAILLIIPLSYLIFIHSDNSERWLNLGISILAGLFLFLFLKLERIDYSPITKFVKKFI
jgi:hypothetical protein|tara:strand:+ start:786 stop:989 length:204 start_codon:yes stop_codon:yes gene_type:complete